MDQPQVLGTIPWSTRGSTKEGGRNRTKKQSSHALANRPARRGGLSARATRTVRQETADCPHGYSGPSDLGRKLSVKANRTSSSEPRKTDRPWGARGLSARHPRTVRLAHADRPKPRPTKTRNHNGSRTKASKNTKNTQRTARSRTVRQPLADRPRLADRTKNSSTPKVNTSNPSPDLPNCRSCWYKGLGTW
jgi:hypothetical protein